MFHEQTTPLHTWHADNKLLELVTMTNNNKTDEKVHVRFLFFKRLCIVLLVTRKTEIGTIARGRVLEAPRRPQQTLLRHQYAVVCAA